MFLVIDENNSYFASLSSDIDYIASFVTAFESHLTAVWGGK